MANTFEQDWQELCGKIEAVIAMPIKQSRRADGGILAKAKAEIQAEDEAARIASVKAVVLKARELDKQVDDGFRALIAKKKDMLKMFRQLEAWSQGKEPAAEPDEEPQNG